MQPISTYLRCKPHSNPTRGIIINDSVCDIILPEQDGSFQRNSSGSAASRANFTFSGIFNSFATQYHVYECVCSDVLDGLVKGINGTIFAYGQTGSGKTYTMTGSPESYSNRGLIPLCLENVFTRIQQFPTDSFQVRTSRTRVALPSPRFLYLILKFIMRKSMISLGLPNSETNIAYREFIHSKTTKDACNFAVSAKRRW